MRIGYSFWGFLGEGITDTPDGGRSHRATLIDALTAAGHDVVFLQTDRDRVEAGTELPYTWEAHGFPAIDTLMLEWRWPIPGRNTTPCETPGHTCDLHRQADLIDFYTRDGLPTILWDKDRQLPADDGLRALGNVTVCEAALHPSPGAESLLFPVADEALDQADPAALTARERRWTLAYVGNQYDRDDCFDRYFAPASAIHPDHLVAGKWNDTGRWPHVRFLGRVPFSKVADLYGMALTTILLLPDRHLTSGQMTQRLFEAVLAGCLPLCPAEFRSADRLLPDNLIVSSGSEATDLIGDLAVAGPAQRAELLAACLERLDLMRASRQVKTLEELLTAGADR
ncbi:glycosyltransferase family protein [Actinocorallia longicatena]|uniref:Spore protein YkvP/CgeB glycosyl transferase-like domain-containing protein n=1 Tax=Actinocorallia longicatena TaxID=111803 RepID=A0ABP6QFT5_9ACTN